MAHIHVVWNSQAGSAKLHQNLYDSFVASHAIDVYDTSDETLAALGGRLTADDILVVAGGDGSIHRVVNYLYSIDSPATLAILPMGTGNDLARSLGISLNPVEAAQNILLGRSCRLDLVAMVVDGDADTPLTRTFINLASGGNSQQVNEAVTQDVKEMWGPLCYLRGALGALGNLQPFKVTASVDGKSPMEYSIWNVIIANGRTAGGGMNVAPRANPTDSKLDVILISAGDMIDLAELGTQFVMGDYLDHPAVTYQQVDRVKLHFDPPTTFSVDGETIKGTTFEFQLIPQAVNVIVGQNFMQS